MVDSYGTILGLWKWMHKQYSRLVQVKASKRLSSDQLESDNSHYCRMLLTRHNDQRPFDETVCDEVIANGGVKKRPKRRKTIAMTDA